MSLVQLASLDVPPCQCGSTEGTIKEQGAHMRLECAGCAKYIKFVSKAALGLPARSVSTRPDIKPAQRSRILMRDGSRCRECGAGPPTLLHVGHIVSVAEGRKFGLTYEQLYSDHNLVTMCEECNLGLGEDSVVLHLAVVCLKSNLLRDTAVSTTVCVCGDYLAAHQDGGACIRCDCTRWKARG